MRVMLLGRKEGRRNAERPSARAKVPIASTNDNAHRPRTDSAKCTKLLRNMRSFQVMSHISRACTCSFKVAFGAQRLLITFHYCCLQTWLFFAPLLLVSCRRIERSLSLVEIQTTHTLHPPHSSMLPGRENLYGEGMKDQRTNFCVGTAVLPCHSFMHVF